MSAQLGDPGGGNGAGNGSRESPVTDRAQGGAEDRRSAEDKATAAVYKLFGASMGQSGEPTGGWDEAAASACLDVNGAEPELAAQLIRTREWCETGFPELGLRALARADMQLVAPAWAVASMIAQGKEDGADFLSACPKNAVEQWSRAAGAVIKAYEGVRSAAQIVDRLGDWRDIVGSAVQIAALAAGRDPVSAALREDGPRTSTVERGTCVKDGDRCSGMVVNCVFCVTQSCSQCIADEPVDDESTPPTKKEVEQLMKETAEAGHPSTAAAPVMCHQCQRESKVWPVHVLWQLFFILVSRPSRAKSKWRPAEDLWPAVVGQDVEESEDTKEARKKMLAPMTQLYEAGPALVGLAERKVNALLASKMKISKGLIDVRYKPATVAGKLLRRYAGPGRGPEEVCSCLAEVASLVAGTRALDAWKILDGSSFGKFAGALAKEKRVKTAGERGAAPRGRDIDGGQPYHPQRSPAKADWRTEFSRAWEANLETVHFPALAERREGPEGASEDAEDDDEAETEGEDKVPSGSEASVAGSGSEQGTVGEMQAEGPGGPQAASTPRGPRVRFEDGGGEIGEPGAKTPQAAKKRPRPEGTSGEKRAASGSGRKARRTTSGDKAGPSTAGLDLADSSDSEGAGEAQLHPPGARVGEAAGHDLRRLQQDSQLEPDLTEDPTGDEGLFYHRLGAGMDIPMSWEAVRAAWRAGGAEQLAVVQDKGLSGFNVTEKGKLQGHWRPLAGEWPDEDVALPPEQGEGYQKFIDDRVQFVNHLMNAFNNESAVPIGAPSSGLAGLMVQAFYAYVGQMGGDRWAANGGKGKPEVNEANGAYQAKVLKLKAEIATLLGTGIAGARARGRAGDGGSPRGGQLMEKTITKFPQGAEPPTFNNSGGFRGWSRWRTAWRAAEASIRGAPFSTRLNLLSAYTSGESQYHVRMFQSKADDQTNERGYQQLYHDCWKLLENKYGSPEEEHAETVGELRQFAPVATLVDIKGYERAQDLMLRLEETFKSTKAGKALKEGAGDDKAELRKQLDRAMQDYRREMDKRLPPEFLLSLTSSEDRNAMGGSFYKNFIGIMQAHGANPPSGLQIVDGLKQAQEQARMEESTFSYLTTAIDSHVEKLRPMTAVNGDSAAVHALAAGTSGGGRKVFKKRTKAPEPTGGGCVLCGVPDHTLGSKCPLSWREARAKADKVNCCKGCCWPKDHSHRADRTCPFQRPCRFCGDGSVHHPRLCSARNPNGGPTIAIADIPGVSTGSEASASEDTQQAMDPRNIQRVKEALTPFMRGLARERALEALKEYHAKGDDMWRRQDNFRGRGGRRQGGRGGGQQTASQNYVAHDEGGLVGAEWGVEGRELRQVPLPRSSAPVLEAVAVFGGKSVDVAFLLDDGSDLSMVGRSVVSALGLKTGEAVRYQETVANKHPRPVTRPYYKIVLRRRDGEPGEVTFKVALGDNETFGKVQTGGDFVGNGAGQGPRRLVRVDGLVGRAALSVVAPLVSSVKGKYGAARRYEGPLGVTWAAPASEEAGGQGKAAVFYSEAEDAGAGQDPNKLDDYEDARKLVPRNPFIRFPLAPDEESEWSPDRLADHLSSLEAVGLAKDVNKPGDLPIWDKIHKQAVVGEDGRITVPLPLRPEAPKLVGQEGISMARSRMYQVVEGSDEDSLSKYKSIFEKLEQGGVIGVGGAGPGKVISWFGVRKADGGMRVVLDCNIRSGYLLHFFAGPSLTGRVADKLFSARLGEVLGTGDLEAAFFAVEMEQRFWRYFRFLLPHSWAKTDVRKAPRLFEFRRLVMGAPPSPFLLYVAVFKAMEMAAEKELISPKEAEEFMAGLYVDDAMVTGSSEAEVLDKLNRMKALFSSVRMNLTKMKTTSSSTATFSYLGMAFNPDGTIGLRSPGWEKALARTNTVIKLAAVGPVVYDPHGFWVHITLGIRKLLQAALVAEAGESAKKGFARKLTKPEVTQMEAEVKEIAWYKEFKIPRKVIDGKKRFEVLAFADASDEALGAVMYIVQTGSDGRREAKFLSAKSRIAPIGKKKRTIPALEFSALDLLSKLVSDVCGHLAKVHDLLPFRITLCTDSAVTWWWAAGPSEPSGLWQQGTRARIRSRGHDKVFHVPGRLNPADVPSRSGHRGEDYVKENEYHGGPAWVKEDVWPLKETLVGGPDDEIAAVAMVGAADEEFAKREAECTAEAKESHERPFVQPDIPDKSWRRAEAIMRRTSRRSYAGICWGSKEDARGKLHVVDLGSWEKLVYTVAKDRKHPRDKAVSQELRDKVAAEWVLAYQLAEAGKTVKTIYDGHGDSRTRDLNLYVAREDMLRWGVAPVRVGLGRAEELLDGGGPLWIPAAAKNPEVILLFLRDAHKDELPAEAGRPALHLNMATTINRLLGKVKGKSVLRVAEAQMRRESFCGPCLRAATRTFRYPMPPGLKDAQKNLRVPFWAVGVDLLGPYAVAGGAERSILFVVCLSTRAVWATLMPGQDQSSVVTALLQLQAEHRCPAEIYSDRGSVFEAVSASWRRQEAERPSLKLPSWHLNQPNNPKQGGAWERLVGLVKDALYKAMGQGRTIPVMSQHLFLTFLKLAVAAVNERPLIPPTASDSPLCPKDFLKPKVTGEPGSAAGNVQELYATTKLGDYYEAFEKFFYLEWLPRVSERAVRPAGLGVAREPVPGETCLLNPPGVTRPFVVVVSSVIRSQDGQVRSVNLVRPGHKNTLVHPVNHLRPFPSEGESPLPCKVNDFERKYEIPTGKDSGDKGLKEDHSDTVENPPPESVDVQEAEDELPTTAAVEVPEPVEIPEVAEAEVVVEPQESSVQQGEERQGRPRRKAQNRPRGEWAWSPGNVALHQISAGGLPPKSALRRKGARKVGGKKKRVSWSGSVCVKEARGDGGVREYEQAMGGGERPKIRPRGRAPSPRRPSTEEGRPKQFPMP